MNFLSNNKLLTWLVILLLAANAATITMFWLTRPKHAAPPPRMGDKMRPAEFLEKELGLDSSQREQLRELIMKHRDSADKIREKITTAKNAFFDLLREANPADSSLQSASLAANPHIQELDLLTFNHFKKVRAICNPAQQQKFDSVIHTVVKMMNSPRPGSPPPHEGRGRSNQPRPGDGRDRPKPPPGEGEDGPPPGEGRNGPPPQKRDGG
jgi:periplasmic protein CpxP/Spy